ncbi:MAG: NUDIX hydrolase [Saccharofermentans sp.]|nr:NUDIX hydrolase [Saccharofermentans sp.]
MEIRDANGMTEEEFVAVYKTKNYPRPYLTADVVVFDKEGKVLLIKRKGHPFLGKFAFPGGFVNPDETVEEAASRELMEETGLSGIAIRHVGIYSKPGRDPRGWIVTSAYTAKLTVDVKAEAGDDAAEAVWFELQIEGDKITLRSENLCFDSTELAFDHDDVLRDALRI